MPTFLYKARKSGGEVYEGTKDVKDRFTLFKEVKAEGGEVMSVRETKSHKKIDWNIPFLGPRLKTHDKITFARNLSAMIEAGLSVSRALSVMERQSKNKTLKKIVNDIIQSISEGKSLSQAMDKHIKIFSSLFVSMIKAGEESGTLATSLKVIALQMDRSYTLHRKVKGAMMYPSVIVSAMILIAILLLAYVVPTLMKTFTELNLKLPWSTQLVVTLSNAIRNDGVLVFLGLIVFVGLVYGSSKTAQGKAILNMLVLKIPVIGELVREVNTARTARTMSSLLNAGVDVVESVNITRDVMQNVHYKKVLVIAEEAIKKGTPMSSVFLASPKLYPTFLGEMMSVGEETGKMGEMLLGVANFYEEDVEQRTKDMSTIIEPFLMVVIGAAVGFFALSMISPMYSLVNVI